MKRRKMLSLLLCTLMIFGTLTAFPRKAQAKWWWEREQFTLNQGDDFYQVFAACVEADGFLTLNCNVDTPREHVVTKDHDVMLDLNGYTISGTDDSFWNSDHIFELEDKSALTILDRSEKKTESLR